MAILPVSSVSFKNNNVNFKSSNNNEETEMVSTPIISEAPKAIPVMVLMALSPSLLNAAVPKTMEESSNTPKVVMVEDAPEQEISEATYVMSPELQETQQSSAPFGWPQLKNHNIKYTLHGQSRMFDYDMIYTTGQFNDRGNNVSNVYLIPRDNNRPNSVHTQPHEVLEIIYHDIGDKDEFCGAKVFEYLLDKNGNEIGKMWSEVPMDRNSAQTLIYLVTDHSKWDNDTNIKIRKVNTSKLLTPRYEEY